MGDDGDKMKGRLCLVSTMSVLVVVDEDSDEGQRYSAVREAFEGEVDSMDGLPFKVAMSVPDGWSPESLVWGVTSGITAGEAVEAMRSRKDDD